MRDGKDWTTPPVTHSGPKAMLINGWSGSGGDCFPFYFKQSGLGPLIGTRTWGGLIGITGSPRLVDGGGVTVPTFAIYSTNSQWIIEGYGVDPDIEVVDDPGGDGPGRRPAARARGGRGDEAVTPAPAARSQAAALPEGPGVRRDRS